MTEVIDAAQPAESSARSSARIVTFLKSVPATIAAILLSWALFVVGQISSTPIHELFGIEIAGDTSYIHVLTSGLTSSTIQGLFFATFAIAVFGSMAERVLGAGRFVLAAIATQAVSVPLGLWLARTVYDGNTQWINELSSFFLSPSAWVIGSAIFSSALMSLLWKRRVRSFGAAIVLTTFLFSGSLGSIVSLVAFAVGLVCGELAFNNSLKGLKPRPISRREKRVLTTLLVVGVALAPLIVAFHAGAHGPFMRATQYIWQPSAISSQIQSVCQDGSSVRCQTLLLAHERQGWGSALVAIVPVIAQLVLAFGLRKGRHAAWLGSIIATVANLAVIAVQVVESEQLDSNVLANVASGVASALPWIVCLAVFILWRSAFTNRSTLKARTNFWRLTGLGVLVSSLMWVAGSLIFSSGFVPATTLARAFVDLPSRLAPPSVSLFLPTQLAPESAGAWFVYSWSALPLWVFLTIALIMLLRSDTQYVSESVERASHMLISGTSDHLGVMTLWDDNSYFFTDGGYVAYRVHESVAVTTGGPVVTTSTREDVARAFEEYVDAQGWACAWYSVPEDFTRPNFKRLYVAQESVIDTAEEFRGKRFQSIRTARNNAAKLGVTTLWSTWDDLDVDIKSEIEALSEEWVGEKALPEMGFTLGGIDELAIEGTQLLVAHDEAGAIHGVTSWLPVRDQGQVVGYTLDFMRRSNSGFSGVIELLISDAVEVARSQGVGWISLSGAPLAEPEGETNVSLIDTLLSRVGQSIEPLYGFRSLASFKRKFHPTHTNWYLLYEDELALPAIGLAVVKSYLPELEAEDARSAFKLWLRSTRREASN